MRYNDVDNPEDCCRLCQDSAHDGQSSPDKKVCETFVHDAQRTSCYVGEVKDLTNPKKTIGQSPGNVSTILDGRLGSLRTIDSSTTGI